RIKATSGDKSTEPTRGTIRLKGRMTGSFNARTNGASGACGLTQLKTTSIRIKPIKPYNAQCTTFIKANSNKNCAEKTPRNPISIPVATKATAKAPSTLAQSYPPAPGNTRRNGRTSQSVS